MISIISRIVNKGLLPCADFFFCVLHSGNCLPSENKNISGTTEYQQYLCDEYFTFCWLSTIKKKHGISLSVFEGNVSDHFPPLSVGQVRVALYKTIMSITAVISHMAD